MKPMTLALCALLISTSVEAGSRSGRRAPSFALPDAKGQWVDILDYRGKVLVLEIMKTDCPHCQELTKTLEKVKARFGDRVNVLAIVNPPDNLNTVAQYVAKHKVSYPILFDFGTTAANYMQVTPQNSTVDLPHLFIIDKDGRIVEDFGWVEPGKNPLEAGNLIAVLDKIVAAQGAAPAKPAAAKK